MNPATEPCFPSQQLPSDVDGPDTWTCMSCDEENITQGRYDETCKNCQERKPLECDLCEELFIPWKEFPGDRTESGLCRSCYFQEPDPSLGVDRDQGEDR